MLRILALLLSFLLLTQLASAQQPTYDVVIYGGTSAGIAAAIQTSRMGKSVLLVDGREP